MRAALAMLVACLALAPPVRAQAPIESPRRIVAAPASSYADAVFVRGRYLRAGVLPIRCCPRGLSHARRPGDRP
jgi:hypothetical protein